MVVFFTQVYVTDSKTYTHIAAMRDACPTVLWLSETGTVSRLFLKITQVNSRPSYLVVTLKRTAWIFFSSYFITKILLSN